MKAAPRQSLRAKTSGSSGAELTSAPSRRCAYLQEAAQNMADELPSLAAELMNTAHLVAKKNNLPRGVFKVGPPSTSIPTALTFLLLPVVLPVWLCDDILTSVVCVHQGISSCPACALPSERAKDDDKPCNLCEFVPRRRKRTKTLRSN